MVGLGSRPRTTYRNRGVRHSPTVGSPQPDADPFGVACVVGSSVCFGLLPLMARGAFTGGADAFGVLTVRWPITLLLLLSLRALVPAVFRDGAWPKGTELVKVLSLGVFGYAGQAYCYFRSLEFIPSSLAAILLYIAPLVVVVWRFAWFKERADRVVAICVGGAFVGCALVVGPVRGGSTFGVILGLGSGLCYGTYLTWSTEVLRTHRSPWTNLTLIMAGAMGTFVVLGLIRRPRFPTSLGGWMSIGAVATLGTLVGMGLLFIGMPRLGATRASILANIEPLVSVAVGVTLLGETMAAVQVVGAVMVLGAAVVVARTTQAASVSNGV
jgi:drug/metabolite transporter (DMT)-like permease